jgi:hypothetical protein
MSTIGVPLATVFGSWGALGMHPRTSAAAELRLELACHQARPSGVAFKVTVRNGMSEPVSIVVAYVTRLDVEHLASGPV